MITYIPYNPVKSPTADNAMRIRNIHFKVCEAEKKHIKQSCLVPTNGNLSDPGFTPSENPGSSIVARAGRIGWRDNKSGTIWFDLVKAPSTDY